MAGGLVPVALGNTALNIFASGDGKMNLIHKMR